MRAAFVASLVLLGALAAGCSAGTPAAEARMLVAYERSGGFIGVQEHMTVTTRGRVRSDDRDYRLTRRGLRSLERALRRADFSSLERRYAAEGTVSDGFVETVTHAGRAVVVETGGDPPARLEKLLGRLGRLYAG